MRELERNREFPGAITSPLVVVGAGRLGGAVARAARTAGIDVRLAGRDDLAEAAFGAETALFCVPDAAIEDSCAALVTAAPHLRFAGHTSGATGLGALRAAAEAGIETFTLHPLQTFPDDEAEVAGAHAAVSGSSPEALSTAESLAEALGLQPFELPEEARAAYHAAASIASNLLVALEESAAGLLGRAGVENGRELLAPLVLRTAANWAERGPDALTGPIARGDEATVALHLEALAEINPELLPVYEALAARTRELAAEGATA